MRYFLYGVAVTILVAAGVVGTHAWNHRVEIRMLLHLKHIADERQKHLMPPTFVCGPPEHPRTCDKAQADAERK